MSNKKRIPRLRFPEFRGSGAWEIIPLGQAGANLDNKRIPITESDRSKGIIPYYGASGIVDYVNDYIFNEDILCISEDGANLVTRTYPIAFSISGKSWVNNHAHVLRFQNKSTQILIENYLNNIDLKDFLTGMAQPKLNRGMLDIIPIPTPTLPEQQRIADCFSSLDDLIAAEAGKLDGYKTHKKALMQGLFPTTPDPSEGGEYSPSAKGWQATPDGVVPKLRFPEFRGKGEWEEKELGEMGIFIRGLTFSSADVADDGLLVLRSSNIQGNSLVLDKDLVFVNKTCQNELLLRKGDIVICMSNGSKVLVGKSAEYSGSYKNPITIGAFCSLFRPKTTFVKYIFQTESYQKFIFLSIGGGNINNLKNSDLEGYSSFIPSLPEQQKIADCLSSLDELITAQGRKIEALKKHKKGLMQGLFPSADEVGV